MPLHLTKIAFGAKSYAEIEGWFANRPRLAVNTRYCPKRVEELEGGSLYWIHEHAIVARNAILAVGGMLERYIEDGVLDPLFHAGPMRRLGAGGGVLVLTAAVDGNN